MSYTPRGASLTALVKALSPGQVVGSYHLVERCRGIGELWVAAPTGRTRNRKLLLVATASTEQDDRWLELARMFGGYRDARLEPIVEVGRSGSWLYWAAEPVEGPTLEAVLGVLNSQGRGLDPEVVWSLASAFFCALDYLQRATGAARHYPSWPWRLEPSGVAIDGAGRARLLLTSSGADGVAHPLPSAYRAPEEALGLISDIRSQIHVAGTLLYECATGRPLYPEAPDQLDRILYEQPPALSEILPGFPEDLSQIIAWCCEKLPSHRPSVPQLVAERIARVHRASSGADADLRLKAWVGTHFPEHLSTQGSSPDITSTERSADVTPVDSGSITPTPTQALERELFPTFTASAPTPSFPDTPPRQKQPPVAPLRAIDDPAALRWLATGMVVGLAIVSVLHFGRTRNVPEDTVPAPAEPQPQVQPRVSARSGDTEPATPSPVSARTSTPAPAPTQARPPTSELTPSLASTPRPSAGSVSRGRARQKAPEPLSPASPAPLTRQQIEPRIREIGALSSDEADRLMVQLTETDPQDQAQLTELSNRVTATLIRLRGR